MSKSEEEKLGKSCEQVAVQEIKKEVGCSVSKFDQEDDSKEEILLDDLLKSKYDGRTIQLPDFAIVYSFLELFGVFLELPYITMPELEQSIDSTKIFTGGEDIGVLESLHAKLFRKLSKSPRFSILSNFKPSKLSKTVLKFAQMTELPFAWDLEQFGYHILTCAQKLQLLKALCDIQFDENQKFKSILFEAYKADQGASLRLLPFGYEQDGKTVWFHEDGEYNVQVYAGELEENDMWHVRAGNLDDLTEYISILKKLSEVNPKDIAAEKLRLRNAVKQEEKEKRRLERERQRQLQKEEKNDKKKGRKTKVIINTSESEEEDDGCCRCLANNQSDLVLLCDGCDAAYHTLCLRPPVESIPEGDWYCPFCLQVKLIESLGVKLNELSAKIKARERKSKRMVFYGISPANIVDKTSEDIVTRRSGRGAKRIDYNFSEYDELIKEAVNGKDEKESLPSDRVSARNTKQKRQRRKLNDLDSDNEDDFDSGDNSFSNYDSDKRDDIKHFINDHDETEERRQDKHLRRSRRFKTRRKRSNLDEDEEDSNKSDSDSFDSKKPKRRLRQRKITRYDETPFSSENEEPIKSINPEEVDEWIGDEQSSELSESEDLNSEISDSPKQRRILMHRKVKNNVNLCEDDTEDDSEEDEEECGFSEESLDGVNSEKDEQVMESEQVPNTPSEEQSRDNKSGDEKCREITQNAPNVNDQIKPLEHSDIKSIDDMKIVKPLPTTKELKAESNIVSMTFTGVTTSLFSPVIQHTNKSFCHPRERFKQVTKSKSPSSSPTKTSDNIHQQQPIIQAVPFSKASSLPLHPREIYNNLLKNKATEIPNLSTQNTSSAFIHHSSSPSTLCQSYSSSSSLGCSTILTPTQNISSNASFHNITSPQDLNASRLQFNNIHGNYFSNSGYEPSYTQSQRFPTPGCLPPQQIGVQAHSYNHGASPSLGFYPIRSTLYSPRQQGQYRPSPAFPNVHSSTGYFMESAVSSPSLYPPPYEYSDHIRPPVHIGVYPYSQYSGVQNVGNQNVKQDREIKKQLKEQAKQERELKKLEKLQEKEKKKQKKVSTVNRGVDGKSNMNFFRNMVISPDNNKEDTNEQFQ